MKTNVLVTVTLPVFNAMPYLEKAVESVLAQSYKNFKFIIIDDGSTDDSYKYLKSIKDDRLELITQDNRGLGYTLNKLFSLSKTKYTVRFDADDICNVERLYHQVKFMENNPDIVLSGTDIYFLCDERKVESSNLELTHETIIEKLLLKRFSICHPSIIVRNDAFVKSGGYKIEGAGEDLDFFLRMSQVGRLANLDRVLLGYRLRFNSLSMIKRSELHLGYDYAVYCYNCRETGKVEPEYEEFIRHKESYFYNFKNYFDGISESLYRKSIFFDSKGQYFFKIVYYFVAAILRPRTSFYHIKKKLKKLTTYYFNG